VTQGAVTQGAVTQGAVPQGAVPPDARRPLVMGVLNVTPDSFSDGGLFTTVDAAVAHGLELMEAGADVVDVGGESSRPGAEPVTAAVELERVIPVVRALSDAAAERPGRLVRVSVDTVKPVVAAAALAAGATLLNDISASLYEVAAEAGAGWVAMHMRGQPRTMQEDPQYADVVGEVRAFLQERAGLARQAGVGEVWVDPGIGFGKTPAHNLSLLRHVGDLVNDAAGAGCAGVVVGTSRKRFLGVLAARPGSESPAPLADRVEGSLATAAAALVSGVGMVRVHDVAATVQMARLYGPAA
jgi:dihydropteroate synthase